MSLSAPPTLYRFESKTLTGTVIDPDNGDALVNLNTAHGGVTALEYQVKVRPGAADPPAISKAIASGITILTQSGTTLGQFTVALVPADFSTVPAGQYYYDVVLIFSDTTRMYVVKPSLVLIKDVVNPI